MTKKSISRRLIFIAIWNNKISTSCLGEIMVPACFTLRPRVFHQIPCFPHPVFSTRPRVFNSPGTRTPGPRTPYHGPTPAPRFPPSHLTVLFLKRTPYLGFSAYLICYGGSKSVWDPNIGFQAVWVIDQMWGQDGWILTKFFFACLRTETKSRSIN